MSFNRSFNRSKVRRMFQSIKRKSLYRSAVFVVLSAVLVLFAGCWASETAEDVGGVTAQQIIENPSAYVGKTVTVSGDVEEIYGPKAFNMDSGLSVGELLVIGREPFPKVPEGTDNAYVVSGIATVTGTVRMFVTADIEREVGWDLTPEIEAEYNGKPVLIAQQAQFQPAKGNAAADTSTMRDNNNGMSDDTADTDGGMTNTGNNNTADGADNVADDKMVDINVYARLSEPDRIALAGRDGEFNNVEVKRVIGPKTFTINTGSGSNEMYVMLDNNAAKAIGTQGKIDVGDKVSISGEFKRLQAEEVMNTANARFRELNEQERQFMKDKKIYLDVNKINVSN